MAVKFLTGEYAKLEDTDWLQNISSLSFYATVRFDDDTNPQSIFRHILDSGGSHIFARRHGAGAAAGKVEWSVKSNDTVEVYSASALSPSVAHNICGTWKKDEASDGIKLYINGVQAGSESTADQTDYSLEADLHIGARYSPSSEVVTDYLIGAIEKLIFFPDTVLTLDQVVALGEGHWPHSLNLPRPAVFYPMLGNLSGGIADMSGNGRSILASNIEGGALESSSLSNWLNPNPTDDIGTDLLIRRSESMPDTFDSVGTVSYPVQQKIFSGLVPGTIYEFKLNATDAAGNTSGDSDIVEATAPTTTADPDSAIPWRRSRNVTKFTS